MSSAPRSQFLGLKVASTVAAAFAFALVVFGAIVRINGAGMTCPDWPRCRGVWIPDLSSSVVYEWAHRVGAPVVTLLILTTFALAYRHRRELGEAMRFAWAALGMVVLQIVIGGLTIKYANNPPSVAAHLVVGIGTFISLLLVAYASWAEIDERFVKELSLGQTAEAYGRNLLSRTYPGRVIEVEKVMGGKTVFTRASSERKDLHVLQVVIEMEPGFSAPVGLQVDVRIRQGNP